MSQRLVGKAHANRDAEYRALTDAANAQFEVIARTPGRLRKNVEQGVYPAIAVLKAFE